MLNACISNSKRHTLAILANSDDNKVTSLTALGNQWCFDFKKEYLFRKLLFKDNFVHR